MKKIAIYGRVSTSTQNIQTQLRALHQYAERRDFTIEAEYTDVGISGSKDKRPGLDAMMKDARLKRFDAIVVARFDRLFRSTQHMLKALAEFEHLDISFISLAEDLNTGSPSGKLLFTVIAAIGEFEKSLIRERVVAGQQRAMAEGVRFGRPEVIVSKDRVAEYRAEGKSMRWIATKLGVSSGKIFKIIKAAA